MNQVKVGAILSYLLIFLNNIIKLTYTPFLIRSLGQSEFGLYSIAAAAIGYLTIMDLGFGNAIIRYTAKFKALEDQDSQNTIQGMFMLIYSILGLFVAFAGIIVYSNIDSIFGGNMTQFELNKLSVLILLLTFNLAITLPFNLYKSIIIAHEKFVFSKLLNIANVIMNPIFMIPLLIMGYKSIALVVVLTFVNLLTIATNYWYCKKIIKIKPSYKKFDKLLFKEISYYSFFVFLNGIVDQIYWNTGQFVLGAVAGTVMVAVYAVAITIKNLYFSSSTSISGLLLPKITSMVSTSETNSKISELFIKVGRLQFIVLAPILSCFILFGNKFIVLWAGAEYIDAYPMALIILIPLTIPLIQNLGITILQAYNRQRFRSVSYIIIAIINLFVSIPMAKAYGGLGCAITTGSCLLIGNGFLMNWYYYSKIKIAISRFWQEIFILSLPVFGAVVVFVGFDYFLNISFNLFYYLLQVVIFIILLFSFFWAFGFNSYEKSLVYNIKSKFKI